MAPKSYVNISYQDLTDLDQQHARHTSNVGDVECLYASRNKLCSVEQLARYKILRELYLRGPC